MYIVREAFERLYPDKELNYDVSLKYSGKFNAYNANVKRSRDKLEFNLSKKWKTINKEIQIGLIQELLLKVLKDKKRTQNIEMYNVFMKKIHIAVPKTKINPVLEESFDIVNEKYFYGLIEKPNLVWGQRSTTKLGSYEYGSDTIKISSIFRDYDKELLNYVMYHEMLHKKYKFHNKNGRSYHHTRLFKRKEREFVNSEEMEKSIKKIVNKKRFFSNFVIRKL